MGVMHMTERPAEHATEGATEGGAPVIEAVQHATAAK